LLCIAAEQKKPEGISRYGLHKEQKIHIDNYFGDCQSCFENDNNAPTYTFSIWEE